MPSLTKSLHFLKRPAMAFLFTRSFVFFSLCAEGRPPSQPTNTEPKLPGPALRGYWHTLESDGPQILPSASSDLGACYYSLLQFSQRQNGTTNHLTKKKKKKVTFFVCAHVHRDQLANAWVCGLNSGHHAWWLLSALALGFWIWDMKPHSPGFSYPGSVACSLSRTDLVVPV